MKQSANFNERQRSADAMAEAHSLWYKEFGHRYLFMLANKCNLSQDQATAIATLVLLNDIASTMKRFEAAIVRSQEQPLGTL